MFSGGKSMLMFSGAQNELFVASVTAGLQLMSSVSRRGLWQPLPPCFQSLPYGAGAE